jgi:hypothetical protein
MAFWIYGSGAPCIELFQRKSAEYGVRVTEQKSGGDWMYLLFLGTGALFCYVPYRPLLLLLPSEYGECLHSLTPGYGV